MAMLVAMKNNIKTSLLILALITSCASHAALYKGLDAEGNVAYSDTPFDDAERYTPPPISVVETPKAEAEKKAAKEEKPVDFKYTDFDIVSPINRQTIRNEPDVTVSLDLKPGLNTEQGHGIWLLSNGKAVVKNAKSVSLQLGRLNRGAHSLQAQVRDKQGKIIVRTRSITIFIHQNSI